jgi:DNA adenine methylase
MKSPIPWVGGKSKLLWLIHTLAPERYCRFIDVFGGSGTVTLNHPLTPGCMEVYNDYNSNLTNLFLCIKERPLALLKELGFLPLDARDEFNVLCKFLAQEELTQDYLNEELELADRFFPPAEAEAIKELLLKRTQL